MQIKTRVTFNFWKLNALKKKAGALDEYSKDGFRRAGIIYTEWMLKRFDQYSRGGGNWRPISQRRFNEKGNRRILYDTGDLRRKLQASKSLLPLKKRGISLGIGSWSGRHRPSGMSIKNLAEKHQLGRGKLPSRVIVANPTRAVKARMKEAIFNGYKTSIAKAGLVQKRP